MADAFDPMLAALIGTVKTTDAQITISVQIGGMLLSGLLISHRTYIDIQRDLLDEEGSAGTVAFSSLYEQFKETLAASDDDSLAPIEDSFYLRDVTFVAGNMRGSLPIWCGRCDAITGWFLGMIKSRFEVLQ